MNKYCDCTESYDRRVYSYYANQACPLKYDVKYRLTLRPTGCYMKPAMPPVAMTNLGGFRVCGKRSGSSFRKAIRVDRAGQCQNSYKRCNPGSKNDNAICVMQGEKCPITGLKFVNNLNELHGLIENGTYSFENIHGHDFVSHYGGYPEAKTVNGDKLWYLGGKL